jgi:hypothetical protein
MSDSTLYDDDILLWSEQQAEVIRRLRETAEDLPEDLDLENVAEEIESVGRSMLASVQIATRDVLFRLIKLIDVPKTDVARHLRCEIGHFQFEVANRYSPSMRSRIDVDELWAEARYQFEVGYGERGLPDASPITLDELLAGPLDIDQTLKRLRESLSGQNEAGHVTRATAAGAAEA